MRGRRAFSLAELLVVLAVIAALAGCAAFVAVNLTTNLDREAEDLAAWLTERLTRAQTEGSSFTLLISRKAADNNMSMTLIWLTGRGKGERESYENDRVFMYDQARIMSRTYNGAWQTLTPALTVCVEPLSRRGAKLYVKVSGEGRINVSKNWKD
jgi:prepilin-type N-terminal cleavage/methylation domain-containing protein